MQHSPANSQWPLHVPPKCHTVGVSLLWEAQRQISTLLLTIKKILLEKTCCWISKACLKWIMHLPGWCRWDGFVPTHFSHSKWWNRVDPYHFLSTGVLSYFCHLFAFSRQEGHTTEDHKVWASLSKFSTSFTILLIYNALSLQLFDVQGVAEWEENGF